MRDSVLWAVILGGMFATYATRLSFIVVGAAHERLPRWLRRGLHHLLPAVLAALVLPELLRPAGALDVSAGNHRLLAGLLAALVAWRARSVALTIAAGMAALWLLSLL